MGQPVLEEPALKKKKKKKRKESEVAGDLWEEEPDTDLEVVLVKKGNTDEAHIDQVRRKALQEEIDRESGKTEVSETRTGTQFGQWDTAGFENEEQKLKFLKLMGGFKNLSPSFSRPPSTLGRPNMALSKQAADSLQQGLQRDYDRALSWKYSRGVGLGFAPRLGQDLLHRQERFQVGAPGRLNRVSGPRNSPRCFFSTHPILQKEKLSFDT